MRRSYLKEGRVQLTALDSLLTHSRYLFLFTDLLLVAKQKGVNSYKLKDKVRLDRVWIALNNCSHSFLIGWPICNYIAHFPTEEEKINWYEFLKDGIQRSRSRTNTKFTTLPVFVRIEGRDQVMKKKIGCSQTSSELLDELVNELSLCSQGNLVILFDNGRDTPTLLQGPEIIFSVVLDFVFSTRYRISEAKIERLDTFPLISCRLILTSMNASRSSPAQTIVTHFKRVLSRSDSRRFFGRQLSGSSPPQPVLTMIDHLFMNGIDVEGIFRKSPKQTAIRVLRTQLDRGIIPDFSQYSPHVIAALLKEYLRAIPGKILLSGNQELWMDAIAEGETVRRHSSVRKLLDLLPSSHSTLLVALLRLLRSIARSKHSKMCTRSLAICIAPNLLDCPRVEGSTARLPQLTEYLIINAPTLFDSFQDAQPTMSSSLSNDSGLSDVDIGVDPSASPDSVRQLSSISDEQRLPFSSVRSADMSNHVCQHYIGRSPQSAYFVNSLSTDDEEDDGDNIAIRLEYRDEADDHHSLSNGHGSTPHKPHRISTVLEWKNRETLDALNVELDEEKGSPDSEQDPVSNFASPTSSTADSNFWNLHQKGKSKLFGLPVIVKGVVPSRSKRAVVRTESEKHSRVRTDNGSESHALRTAALCLSPPIGRSFDLSEISKRSKSTAKLLPKTTVPLSSQPVGLGPNVGKSVLSKSMFKRQCESQLNTSNIDTSQEIKPEMNTQLTHKQEFALSSNKPRNDVTTDGEKSNAVMRSTDNAATLKDDSSKIKQSDTIRKERRKQRSILEEPLEVNWSVDELKAIFQKSGAPVQDASKYHRKKDGFHDRSLNKAVPLGKVDERYPNRFLKKEFIGLIRRKFFEPIQKMLVWDGDIRI
ncbi:hypothetical protein AB6A40_006468 [Gnathostoma spinigerum]|uniref:Rho-GAP domain-containing protein n=1 Tax=Gnathostoma spinigerum TaxID=75299 RepID=A0ABD6ER45_9BILA